MKFHLKVFCIQNFLVPEVSFESVLYSNFTSTCSALVPHKVVEVSKRNL